MKSASHLNGKPRLIHVMVTARKTAGAQRFRAMEAALVYAQPLKSAAGFNVAKERAR
jgi:hypothetical protein